MKWVIASTCMECEEMGEMAHTAIAQDKDADGQLAPYIFDSKEEAEVFEDDFVEEDLLL